MTEGYEVAYHDGQSTNETKVSVNRLRAVDQRLHYRMIHINRLDVNLSATSLTARTDAVHAWRCHNRGELVSM